MNFLKHPLRMRLKLLRGVLRRLIWNLFRPGYVKMSLSKRSGKCLRCGACCQLAWRCRYLQKKDGVPSCRIHKCPRPPNCKTFPIDPQDLADVALISPNVPCGFSWKEQTEQDCEIKPARNGRRFRCGWFAAQNTSTVKRLP